MRTLAALIVSHQAELRRDHLPTVFCRAHPIRTKPGVALYGFTAIWPELAHARFCDAVADLRLSRAGRNLHQSDLGTLAGNR